jgi:hypothetical protein
MIVELDERSDIFAVESQRTGDLLFVIFVGYAFCPGSKEVLATVKKKKTSDGKDLSEYGAGCIRGLC